MKIELTRRCRGWRTVIVRTFSLALFLGAAAAARAHDIQDDRGKRLRITTPAKRLIAIAPHLTEIAFAAGVGDRLVAVSAYSDFPPEAKRLPQVGDGARVDIERILTLRPDWVLAWKSGNQAGDIAKLERLGIRVWVSEAARLADIARLLRDVAVLAGDPAAGEQAASVFEGELNRLRARTRQQQPQRVFYEIWHQPLLTVNGAHMISDVITLCGGMNVFADVPVLTPAVSLEAVLAARPQIVLGGGSAEGSVAFRTRWANMPLSALRTVPAHYIAPDTIQRQSPRVIDGVRAMCRHLEDGTVIDMAKKH